MNWTRREFARQTLAAGTVLEYGGRLIAAGVATELAVYPGAYHAFDMISPTAEVSKRFTTSWTSALRRAFASA